MRGEFHAEAAEQSFIERPRRLLESSQREEDTPRRSPISRSQELPSFTLTPLSLLSAVPAAFAVFAVSAVESGLGLRSKFSAVNLSKGCRYFVRQISVRTDGRGLVL
jgi:hypothetical protein